MTDSNTRPDDSYDVVVIGSGMAGLTSATRLAQSGLKVLLVEKNDWIGGYAHGFSQDGFYWDHGGHIFLAYKLGAQARKVFQQLKLDEHVEMRPIAQDYQCVFPDDAITVPDDITAAADAFSEKFPAERDGIQRTLTTMEALIDQVDTFVPSFHLGGRRRFIDPVLEQVQRPRVGKLASKLPGLSRMPGKDLMRYQQATLADLLNDNIKDPRLKGYFSMLSAGIGAGPESLSAVIAGVFFIHALRTMWLPKGGFGKLAQTTANVFEGHGGTLRTGDGAARILTEKGRVSGVELLSGKRIRARAVISACDARTTLLKMVDQSLVPAKLRDDLPKMGLTPSIFQVHLGVEMDLTPFQGKLSRLNFMYPHDDIERAMQHFPNGKYEDAAYFAYVATLHQREMAPAGRHSMKLEAYTTLGATGIDWERDKQKIADSFIDRTEKLIPGLRKSIITQALRTPRDLANDTGNSEGAFAGWAFSPDMLSRRRPQPRTPVRGLYLAGHWTTPAAGVPWVMVSGFSTAEMVINDLGHRGGAPLTPTTTRNEDPSYAQEPQNV